MNNQSEQTRKWPIVISTVTILYMILYIIFYFASPKTTLAILMGHAALCSLLAVGSIGVAMKRRWAVKVLVIACVLMALKIIFSFITVIAFMGGVPPLFAMLGILTGLIPTLFWPAFVLFWFSRRSVRDNVTNQWR